MTDLEFVDYSTQTCLCGVIAAVSIWSALYKVLSTCNPSRSPEWHCRSVTLIHAFTVISMASWCGFVQGPWPLTDAGGPTTVLQHWTCTICMGYFIFDLAWCLIYQSDDTLMIIHHAISIFGNFLVLWKGKYGTEMIATIWGTELTNPLLQARWFLRETNRHKSWTYEINDFLFVASFGFLRIGMASYLLYTYFLNPITDWIGRSGGTCIYLIGWIFWIMIVKYAVRKYTKMYKSWKYGDKHKTNGYSSGNNSKETNGHTKNGNAQSNHVKAE